MTTPETVPMPQLADPGEPCAECGTPLAADQRYCLNCGHRRAEARIPFMDVLAAPREAVGEYDTVVDAPPPSRGAPPLAVLALALVGSLGIGALIGHWTGNTKQPVPVVQRAPVVNVSTPPPVVAPGAGGAASTASLQPKFKSDWPSGKTAYTVELQTFPNSARRVAAVQSAKTAAAGRGAPKAGVLDSDDYASLDPGKYVLYSGIYAKKADATKALKKLRKGFPGAKVIKVSDSGGGGGGGGGGAIKKSGKVSKKQIEKLHNLPPAQYQKQSSKLPKEVQLPGKPPKKDKKKPGGGSGTTSIG